MTIQVRIGKEEEQIFDFENVEQVITLVSYLLKNKYFNYTKYHDCVEEEQILIRIVNQHSIEV